MKVIFIFFLSMVSILAHSQPVLTSNEMVPFGSSWTVTFAQNASVADTTKGANVIWNFSSVQPSSAYLTINIVDPAQTPYASSFPNSNYAYQEAPVTAYRYFNLTSTKMERVGSWSNSVGLRTYNDPQIEYVFPLTTGVYNLDTWDNNTSPTGGIYEIECIGYGTLILPIGTFNDVLLVRALITESFLYYYSYFWYNSDNGIVLANFLPQGPFTAEAFVYTSAINIPASINESNIKNIQFTNPVTNALMIFNSNNDLSGADYTITNTIGQIVASGSIKTNTTVQTIDMKSLSEGVYFVNLRKERDYITLKVLKQ